MPRPSLFVGLAAVAFAGAACAPPGPKAVDLKTEDGIVLKGTYFASGHRGPAVLMLHQCDEQRKVWDPLGERLAAAGVSAFAIDYRGYGESGGEPHNQLAPDTAAALVANTWPKDIDLAFAFLQAQPGVDRTELGLAGGSCGVSNVLRLAARHPDIKALALLAGGTDREGRQLIASPGGPPVFAAAAADDQYSDFVASMGWIAGISANSRTRFAWYPDGGHAAVVFQKHPDLADAIATWFSAVLREPPDATPATNGVPLKRDIVKILQALDEPDGAAAVSRLLAEARKTDPHAVLFPEAFANQLGYEHLTSGDVKGGIAIMTLNVEAFPDSPNALDSLGDACLANGEEAMALQLARKTIALLAKDVTDPAARKKQILEAANQKLKQLTPSTH
jgi:dienelactone hydrolase